MKKLSSYIINESIDNNNYCFTTANIFKCGHDILTLEKYENVNWIYWFSLESGNKGYISVPEKCYVVFKQFNDRIGDYVIGFTSGLKEETKTLECYAITLSELKNAIRQNCIKDCNIPQEFFR